MPYQWTEIKEGTRADPAPINALGNHVATYHGLRLARQVITTEAVSSIQFNTDDDGRPLNSTLGGEIRMYVPEGASTGTAAGIIIGLRLNGIGTNSYWYENQHSASAMRGGMLGSVRATINTDINLIGGYTQILPRYAYQYINSSGSNAGSYGQYVGGLTNPGYNEVTAINIFVSGHTFPTGTIVEWWERG